MYIAINTFAQKRLMNTFSGINNHQSSHIQRNGCKQTSILDLALQHLETSILSQNFIFIHMVVTQSILIFPEFLLNDFVM